MKTFSLNELLIVVLSIGVSEPIGSDSKDCVSGEESGFNHSSILWHLLPFSLSYSGCHNVLQVSLILTGGDNPPPQHNTTHHHHHHHHHHSSSLCLPGGAFFLNPHSSCSSTAAAAAATGSFTPAERRQLGGACLLAW